MKLFEAFYLVLGAFGCSKGADYYELDVDARDQSGADNGRAFLSSRRRYTIWVRDWNKIYRICLILMVPLFLGIRILVLQEIWSRTIEATSSSWYHIHKKMMLSNIGEIVETGIRLMFNYVSRTVRSSSRISNPRTHRYAFSRFKF